MANNNETQLFALVPLTKENIKVGMVLRSPAQDGSVHIFNDTVVERIDNDGIVHLARPYAYFKNGVVVVGFEPITLSVSQLIRGHFCYVMEGLQPAKVWEE
jgi:hypothetical protein